LAVQGMRQFDGFVLEHLQITGLACCCNEIMSS
jgi:hypothetical protein